MVEPYDKWQEKNATAAKTVNIYGNHYWYVFRHFSLSLLSIALIFHERFCQIRYFFADKRGTKMFHGQWLTHGCKTILQETAHTQALYLLKGSCDDNAISTIFQKCNLMLLEPGDEEPGDSKIPDSNDFHCGLVYSVFLEHFLSDLQIDV